jgi:hypothetical protein|tara:strand:- start:279 stop:974 length:696 start_codon:yes stop_codon:yes gene_type:complete
MLLGCSWLVPNYDYEKSVNNFDIKKPGTPPEYHIRSLLEAEGHSIINFATNGYGNDQFLSDALITLTPEQNIDLIIFCQTDPVRDYIRNGTTNIISEILSYDTLLEKSYRKLNKLKKLLPKSKLVVIGGLTPIEDSFNNIMECKPDYYLRWWIEEFFNKDDFTEMKPLPKTAYGYSILEMDVMSHNEKNNTVTVMDYMQASKYYPDDGHPDKHMNSWLFHELNNNNLIGHK